MSELTLQNWLATQWHIKPDNVDYYRKALTLGEYEVFEYLGDALLDFIVADYLVEHFPDKAPGWLTKKRMTLVSETALAQRAKALGIYYMAILPVNCTRSQVTQRVLADIVEAMLGAIYKDLGLDACRHSILAIFALSEITEELHLEQLDPIGSVQELLATGGYPPPRYTLQKKTGSAHLPKFYIKVQCTFENHSFHCLGVGHSKKEANRIAAQNLYEKLRGLATSKASPAKSSSPVEQLHVALVRSGEALPVYRITKKNDPEYGHIFICQASCRYGGREISESGQAVSKKEAKRQVALKILTYFDK